MWSSKGFFSNPRENRPSLCFPLKIRRKYKWTQWIFTKLYEHGLAYIDEVAVNWCPALGTVLANEEVIDGKSERGGHPVERRPMKQWVLKITAYAERLLQDLEELDWPESIKEMQRNWIGRSEGAEVTFAVDGHDQSFTVFTTRPDTLYGATYVVLAPEHKLVEQITSPEQKAAVEAYLEQAKHKRKDRGIDRGIRYQSGKRRAPADLDRRLRADQLWNWLDHGGTCTRRARL